MWPLLLIRRPLVISHHGYYWLTRGKRDWRERLKINISSRSANIFVSSAIAKEVNVRGAIIPNPYDEILFRPERARHATRSWRSSAGLFLTRAQIAFSEPWRP